jgi:hypothetical protein
LGRPYLSRRGFGQIVQNDKRFEEEEIRAARRKTQEDVVNGTVLAQQQQPVVL